MHVKSPNDSIGVIMDIFHTRLPDKAPKFRALSSPVLQSCIAAPQSQPRRFGRLMWVRRRVACPAALLGQLSWGSSQEHCVPQGRCPVCCRGLFAAGRLWFSASVQRLQLSSQDFPPLVLSSLLLAAGGRAPPKAQSSLFTMYGPSSS